MLVQTGLDYDVVRAELEAQIERLGDDQFATFRTRRWSNSRSGTE